MTNGPDLATIRDRAAAQDFSPLNLTPSELRQVAALRALLDRHAATGTRKNTILVPAEVLIFIRRRTAAGASASAIARELNSLGIRTPRGGLWSHNTVTAPWRGDLVALLADRLHDAALAALPALEGVLDSDDSPERPTLKPTQRRALRAAAQVLRAL